MKKRSLSMSKGFFIFSLLLASCEHPELPGQVSGNLEVSITSIQQRASSRVSDGVPFSRICFAVYDSLGTRVKQINQNADDKHFGTAGFNLPAGNYQVVVVGHSSSGNPTMTNPSKIQFKNGNGFTDTYLYNDRVELSGERVKLAAEVRGIATLCHFVVTDTVPAGVTQMQFQYKGGSSAFDANTGLGCVGSTQTVTFPVEQGSSSVGFDLYTFLPVAESKLHIEAKACDANANVVIDRQFDVPVRQCAATNVSSAYFSGLSTLDIVIDTDTPWGGIDFFD